MLALQPEPNLGRNHGHHDPPKGHQEAPQVIERPWQRLGMLLDPGADFVGAHREPPAAAHRTRYRFPPRMMKDARNGSGSDAGAVQARRPCAVGSMGPAKLHLHTSGSLSSPGARRG